MGAISVSNLGKAYKQYPTRWSRLYEWLDPRGAPRHQLKWVLQDINFTVKPGEAVGIIGINGAGKSTLLKLITGTTQPTKGSIHMTGRVAAMLELGMGFHPDFTGRQNVIMASQLLGFTAEEIALLMPEIEAFAEIGDYIDQPVRVYSSGMQMRLGFSVATAMRPDILIVDEALSVGDVYFQHKSFDRIREFRRNGTTLLMVSHDKAAIQSICDRAILLNRGYVAMQGEPEAVINHYNLLLAVDNDEESKQKVYWDDGTQAISGSGAAKIVGINFFDEDCRPVDVIGVGQVVVLKIQTKASCFIPKLVAGFMIKDRLGLIIYGTNTEYISQSPTEIDVDESVQFEFRIPMNIGPGNYSITVALTGGENHLVDSYEWRDKALLFSVINLGQSHFEGYASLNSSVSTIKYDSKYETCSNN